MEQKMVFGAPKYFLKMGVRKHGLLKAEKKIWGLKKR